MAFITAWPVNGERKGDWDRMVQYYGLCEVLPDRSRPEQTEKTFRDWAYKKRLAFVEGENMVAFDPKTYNPKDSLDRGRFGFLLRYIPPAGVLRVQAGCRRAPQHPFDVTYWTRSRATGCAKASSMTSAAASRRTRELLRLMGFSYLELVNALDGRRQARVPERRDQRPGPARPGVRQRVRALLRELRHPEGAVLRSRVPASRRRPPHQPGPARAADGRRRPRRPAGDPSRGEEPVRRQTSK